MFIQVIQGRVGDPGALKQAMDRWVEELAPGAEGWLGTTAGITDDDEAVAVVRFESEEAARRSSDRPEQGRWWQETARLFSGPATFHDCAEVDTMGAGGSDEAGFVQVVQGQTADVERFRQLGAGTQEAFARARPDVIGGSVAWHDDGKSFTQTVYFTSEDEARRGERAEPPAEIAKQMDDWSKLIAEVRYLDLREPWLLSPGR